MTAFAVGFLVLAALFAPATGRAETEFCPARIIAVSTVAGKPGTIAVKLSALAPRNVTGQFVLETNRGWFRVPFPPLAISFKDPTVESAPIAISVPQDVSLQNIWLSQAAADDPQWGPRGMVTCPPEPERRTAKGILNGVGVAETVNAIPIAPPFSYNCKAPFQTWKVEGDDMDSIPYAPGEYAVARVELDASGHVIDVTALDSSAGDFNLRKDLERRVRHMRFTPAVAYCKPVPASFLLREGVGP